MTIRLNNRDYELLSDPELKRWRDAVPDGKGGEKILVDWQAMLIARVEGMPKEELTGFELFKDGQRIAGYGMLYIVQWKSDGMMHYDTLFVIDCADAVIEPTSAEVPA